MLGIPSEIPILSKFLYIEMGQKGQASWNTTLQQIYIMNKVDSRPYYLLHL